MFNNKHLQTIKSDVSLSPGNVTPPSRVPTPLRLAPKSLRPYLMAFMAFKHGKEFQLKPSMHRTRRLSELNEKEGKFAAALTVSITHTLLYFLLITIDPLRWNICGIQRCSNFRSSNCNSRQHIPPRFLSQNHRARQGRQRR